MKSYCICGNNGRPVANKPSKLFKRRTDSFIRSFPVFLENADIQFRVPSIVTNDWLDVTLFSANALILIASETKYIRVILKKGFVALYGKTVLIIKKKIFFFLFRL